MNHDTLQRLALAAALVLPGEEQEPFTVYRITTDTEPSEVYGHY